MTTKVMGKLIYIAFCIIPSLMQLFQTHLFILIMSLKYILRLCTLFSEGRKYQENIAADYEKAMENIIT